MTPVKESNEPDSLASTATSWAHGGLSPSPFPPPGTAFDGDRTFLEQVPETEEVRKDVKDFGIIAPVCAAFSWRREVSATANRQPFGSSEAWKFEDPKKDDGLRVRLDFITLFQILGTSINGVYHPAGMKNSRRTFRRNIGGGGAPPLFLYYLPEKDSWGVGLLSARQKQEEKVYAMCPGEPGEQPWHVWNGESWMENPASAASVIYRADFQSHRWLDQAAAGHATSLVKQELVGVRRANQLAANEARLERCKAKSRAPVGGAM
eukprot:CAMPEP_0197625776 /NCGR_PEP_ID=MMETSP1338-20131121/5042_1 /TAXON_ID=43686 ORGANISM="Pelagodinium beii, Strain RCC1491" /NCGR_SAMPLE_ID=MMETSP1338 /ASSEMBLY_ACC=CAM_ASM_000754 /LENGTH=263 /DNA_ID=CAMNT_0043196261 /DNA_START=99 /DNA_END=890 /DNA_ORIENTATION=-